MNMKPRTIVIGVLIVISTAGRMPLAAQGLTVSGILDSTLSLRAGAGDSPDFSYGVEEYANVRMQAKVKDRAVFYGAVNFVAAAGDPAANADRMTALSAGTHIAPSAFSGGQNYIAGFELERLYFRLNGEALNCDAGLFRLPFGYSQVWGSSDFLNPKNPLLPDARPRAVLGAGLSWYPLDSLKLLGFGAAPQDPLSRSSGGLLGLSMDKHWERASLQVLYSYESPKPAADQGIHRMGMSVKADLELGLVADILYAYNGEAGTGIDGLSLSAGCDYSFFEGKLIVLAEYLYNGKASSTARSGGGSWSREQYLYSGFTWLFDDYTRLGLALISGLSAEYELFQGCVLILSGQIPLDRNLFADNGERGELGPLPPDELQALLPLSGERAGSYGNFSAKIRLRF